MNEDHNGLKKEEYKWIAGGDNLAESATHFCRCGRCGSKLYVKEMVLDNIDEWFLFCMECKIPIGKVFRTNDKKGKDV